MSRTSRFDRRAFLKGLGLSGAFLPLLDSDLARGAEVPRRFAAIVWPNGVLSNSFFPDGAGANFTLKEATAPLEPHKGDIIVLDDIDNRAITDEFPSFGGHASLGFLLTGGNAKPYFNGEDSAIGNSISVDQHIANELQKKSPTRIHSLVLGVDNREESKADQKYISFRGPAVGSQPNAPAVADDVHAVYKTLFGSGSTTGMTAPTIDKTRLERKSLLDFVGKDLERFGARLGSESKQRVAQHLSSVRDLEKMLDQIPPAPTAYKPPTDDASIDSYRKDDYDKIARAQIELMVGAFATGSTNVATLLWSNGHNNSWVFKWLGGEYAEPGNGDFNVLRNHHEMAHRGDSGPDDGRRKNAVDKYFVSLFAKLLARLKEVPDVGGGTLLDNSVALFANNMGNGGAHSNTRLPWILGGRAGGYFKTGRYLKQASGRPHNGVLVAMANAMGTPVASFGPAQYGGELPGIRG